MEGDGWLLYVKSFLLILNVVGVEMMRKICDAMTENRIGKKNETRIKYTWAGNE